MKQVPKITKCDAARRQLDTAIKLFFHEQDSISIHTLTCAAHQILRDLGQRSILKDDMLERIYPDKRKEWTRSINEAENFFKHADRDPTKILDFYPDTDFLLWDATQMYYLTTGEKTDVMKIFTVWFYMEHDDILIQQQDKLVASNLKTRYKIKHEFFKEFLPLVTQVA